MPAPISRANILYGRLLLRVRDMAGGDRLPSVRQLMNAYQVSQSTIDRAVSRLKEEGFVEAQLGRGIFATGKRRLGTIGLLISDGSGHFSFHAARHARKVLGKAGYDVRLSTYNCVDGIGPAVEGLACDGLIVLPNSNERMRELSATRSSSTPTVVIDLIPEDLDLNAVATDNAFGGALAAKHLIGLGHRRLALIQAEPSSCDSQRARVAGFTQHAELAGVESLEVIDCLGMVQRELGHISGGTYSVAHYGVARVLRERGSLGASGVFADSDMGALGTMKALHEAHVDMPGTVSVIGFDDLPEARYFHPSLTTIRQDLTGWFEAALRIIEVRLAGDTGPAQRIRVRPELVVRESTAYGPKTPK